MALQAQPLLQPSLPDDGNSARRRPLAQALSLWREAPPAERPPPALQRWIEPQRALAAP